MLVIAHRGAPAETIENTRSSFVAALRSGAHMVETDLQLTLDGHLVVHHDTDTGRLMDKDRHIGNEPLQMLQTLRYRNGDGLLTLPELLALIDGRLPLNLELKAQNSGAALAQFLATQAYQGQLLISSKHPHELHSLRATELDLPLGLVADRLSTDLWRELAEHPYQFISLNHRRASQDLIRRLQNLGLQVFVYTVNTPHTMKQLAAIGTNGIFTDNPALAMQVLAGQ